MRYVLAVIAFLLSAPAFAYEIVPYGEGAFMVMTRSVSPAKARIAAVKAANGHCEKMGKAMQPQRESGDQGGPPLRTKDFSMVFSCYAKDQPVPAEGAK